jgi:hypothetical protein
VTGHDLCSDRAGGGCLAVTQPRGTYGADGLSRSSNLEEGSPWPSCEYHLFVVPVVVSGGKHFLPDRVRLQLELLDEHRFGNGVVYLRYRTQT